MGYGEPRPVASNETATGRTLNRRVSARVLNPEAAERYLETEEPAGAEPDRPLRDAIREGVRDGMGEDAPGGEADGRRAARLAQRRPAPRGRDAPPRSPRIASRLYCPGPVKTSASHAMP